MPVTTTKSKWVNGLLTFFDRSTFETVMPVAPVVFYDDFVADDFNVSAAGVRGWTKKDTSAVGTTVEAILANQHGGVVTLELDSQNEKQEAGIYMGDALNWDLDKGPIFEARVAVRLTGTAQTEMYFGLANAYVEGPIAEADAGPTVHAFFCFDASLTPTIHTDDTSNDNDAVATGVTAVEGSFNIFRIDCTNIADVKFYIDGARVGSGTTFDMSTGSAVVTQPFFMVHKETSAGLGKLDIDYVKVWCAR
jgi:hypothetical protein